MKKILVTGITGQVGWELQRTLAPLGHVIGLNSQQLDLTHPDSIRRVIREIAPDVIVNPAAYTAVDLAESQKELCFAINRDAPGILAEEAKRLGSLLIHYSTDYVFDGKETVPYSENHQVNPLNTYGLSKWSGEEAIAQTGCDHLILRTSWVYGRRGKNFLLTMLRLAQEKDHLKIVSDQIGAPTWSRMIAQATTHMLSCCLACPERLSTLSGTYHLTNSGKTDWSTFAETIFEIGKSKRPDSKVPQVTKIQTDEYPTPAVRPLNSILSHNKIYQNFGIVMPDWKHSLELCLAE